MNRILVVTAILFIAAVSCERHSPDESLLHTPAPSPTASATDEKKLLDETLSISTALLCLATGFLGYFTWRASRTAKSTERVFEKIVATLEGIQIRSVEAAVVRTLSACMEQYQRLEDESRDLKTKDPKRYFERLWNLHFSEFQFFKRRYLPEDIYTLWVWVKYKNYRDDPNAKSGDQAGSSVGISEEAGWNHAKTYLQDEEFAKFVEEWLTNRSLERPDIQRIVHSYLPMTVIEISRYKWGWRAFEAPGVETVFPKKDQAIEHAQNRACFRSGQIRVLDSNGNVESIIAFNEADRRL